MKHNEPNPSTTTNDAELTSPDLKRRSLLQGIFLGLGVSTLPSWVLKSARAQAGGPEISMPLGPLGAQDFGPLVLQTVADNLSSVNHQLYAPEGFAVRLVMRAGVNPLTLNTSGTLGHTNPDGGAVFMTPDGGWIYASNSESTPGGASALRFNSAGVLSSYYRICTNTRNNCAGGRTPWDTWITCEEVSGGYAVECDPYGVVAQKQLTALGARNGREAVAIDPRYNACYQTLDSNPAKFIRFVSNPSDLTVLPSGVTRMKMESGVSTRLYIPAFGSLPGFNNAIVPNTATGSQQLRQARPIEWVADSGNNGTNFNGTEGIWYYEIPEELTTIPAAGTVPTRGVFFFATKGDNRIWAIDVENSLIELIYDTQNNQAFPNLRNSGAAAGNFNQVDNVVVSPGGDVLVAEDGTAMRLAIMVNNQPAKLLMQITRGDSEITGPAFTSDGSKLYFSSQRGPAGSSGSSLSGTTYEMTIPPRFRAIQRVDDFIFEEQIDVAPGTVVTTESVILEGFIGPLKVSISPQNSAQFSLNGGAWTNVAATVVAGDEVRVRHTSSATVGDVTETTLTVALSTGLYPVSATFFTVTGAADAVPNKFNFGTLQNVAPNTLIESSIVTPAGFNLPVEVICGPNSEYRIDGGAWTNLNGTLQPGQSLQTRHVSVATARTMRTTWVRAGGISGTFTTRTA